MTQEPLEPLSERELELVRLLGQGLSNKEIARTLYISPNTVKVHLRNIYRKLDVRSRTEATMVAVRMGWIEVASEKAPRPPAAEPAPAPVEESPETTSPEPVAQVEAMPTPPARWQRACMLIAALLVALGLWITWPVEETRSEPFTDRRRPAAIAPLRQASRWQSLAQMPTPRSRLAVVAYDKRIYAIGGESASGVSGVVEIYLPDADRWVRGADKPLPAANVGAAAIGRLIYVPGGSTGKGEVSDRLEVYDPAVGELGRWGQRANLPRGVCAYALAVYQDRLYLFGGWDGRDYVGNTYSYDPHQDRWQELRAMPTRRAFAGAGTIDGRIYVVGGYDGHDELATCEVYDPQADTWASCPPMNAPRGGVGVAVIADALYVIGGGWQSYLVENEYLVPGIEDSTWKTFPSPILHEWRNLGVAVSGTSIYAIGGWNGDFLGVNRAYRALYRLYLPSAIGSHSAND